MQQKCIRIAVIDDHRMFAEALAGRFPDEPDLEVVGVAGSSTEALELFLNNEIHVVALDLDLAGEDGPAVGRRLGDRWPGLGIVVVTAAASEDRVCEAVQMGVRGWVAKQGAFETLLLAIRGTARGETHTPAALLARVLISSSARGRSPAAAAEGIELLTARELHVLRCLIEGLAKSLIEHGPHAYPAHSAQAQRPLRPHRGGIRSQGGGGRSRDRPQQMNVRVNDPVPVCYRCAHANVVPFGLRGLSTPGRRVDDSTPRVDVPLARIGSHLMGDLPAPADDHLSGWPHDPAEWLVSRDLLGASGGPRPDWRRTVGGQ
jgi:DNA-binding NarL/FixJ family response regulator